MTQKAQNDQRAASTGMNADLGRDRTQTTMKTLKVCLDIFIASRHVPVFP